MLIYFAPPLFCQVERAFNLQLTEKLKERQLTVFLPQRDGVEGSKPHYNDVTQNEQRRAIFAVDRDKVPVVNNETDLIAAIEEYDHASTDGRLPS
jgi:nucleoside 2-deoxyribosyltransferase